MRVVIVISRARTASDVCAAVEIETRCAVEEPCHGPEEAHVRTLRLQAASSAALGLRRLTSENLEDSPQVMVSALLVSASRHDAALEQIIGRMSLEPFDAVVDHGKCLREGPPEEKLVDQF
jgi:hypothetical protein